MKIRFCLVTGFIFCALICIKAQEKPMSLVVSQNVVLPGQDIWFGVSYSSTIAKQLNGKLIFPTAIVFLSDKSGKVYDRNIYSPDQPIFTGKFKIAEDLQSGTYILSAAVYNNEFNKVLLEESITVHVFDGSPGSYFQFGGVNDCSNGSFIGKKSAIVNCEENDLNKNKENVEVVGNSGNQLIFFTDTSQCSMTLDLASKWSNSLGLFATSRLPIGKISQYNSALSTRNKICFENIKDDQSFVSISTADHFYKMSRTSFVGSASNYNFDLGILMQKPSGSKLPAFFHSDSKRIYQLKQVAGSDKMLLKIPAAFGPQKGQFLDVLSMKMLDYTSESWLESLWSCAQLMPITVDLNQEKALMEAMEKNILVNKIYNIEDEIVQQKISRLNGVTADDVIDLKKYQPFESLTLFFVEALPQIKVTKTKENKKDIRIMNLDTRNLFPGSPTLMINGVIQTDISYLFDIPYAEVDSIILYRQLSTTRTTFGGLARNGVIDVQTKPGYKLPTSPSFVSCLSESETFAGNERAYLASDSKPHLNQIQFFGKANKLPFCYQHNDEYGGYIIQAISSKGLMEYFYTVKSGLAH